MLKRKREIETLAASMGLEITGFRTEGNNHWRVDIKAPNGRQRPFTFQTRPDPGRMANEKATLRTWVREVQPELLEIAKHGDRPPPTVMATKLSAVLPRHPAREPYLELKATEMIGNARKGEGETMTPDPPAPSPSPAPAAKTLDKMTQAEVMRFQMWMNKERLEGHYFRSSFCEYASKELGFRVTDTALVAWLEVMGVEMPKPPVIERPAKPPSWQEQVNDDLAAIALALTYVGLPQDQSAAMHAIVDRRTKKG